MEKELKKKLNKEWNLFAKPKYPIHCMNQNIKDKTGDYIAIAERAKYCVSSQDVWSLDSYLLRVLYNGLKILKTEQNGYPGYLTKEQWDEELDTAIAWCETLMLDMFVSDLPYYEKYREKLDSKAPLEEIEEARNEWQNMWKFIQNEQERALNDLMDWLKKRLWDLWW